MFEVVSSQLVYFCEGAPWSEVISFSSSSGPSEEAKIVGKQHSSHLSIHAAFLLPPSFPFFVSLLSSLQMVSIFYSLSVSNCN